MKQVNITVSFEDEKLTALRRYMGKKDSEPEAELRDTLQKLYEKFVPVQVREYIEEADADAPAPAPKPKRPAKPAVKVEEKEEDAHAEP